MRLIRSFPYRNVKNLLLRGVDLHTTTGASLLQSVKEEIQKQGAFLPFRTKSFDSLKIHHLPHKAKTCNLTINLEDDDLLLIPGDKTLAECGVENETEISVFNWEEYVEFRANPETKWE